MTVTAFSSGPPTPLVVAEEERPLPSPEVELLTVDELPSRSPDVVLEEVSSWVEVDEVSSWVGVEDDPPPGMELEPPSEVEGALLEWSDSLSEATPPPGATDPPPKAEEPPPPSDPDPSVRPPSDEAAEPPTPGPR